MLPVQAVQVRWLCRHREQLCSHESSCARSVLASAESLRLASVFNDASYGFGSFREVEGKARRTTFAEDLAHSHRAPTSFVKR